MKVSVIIPNYNHLPYLRVRIDSVLNQSYKDFEVILLDDCSIDDSRSIIEEYRSHPKVTHIVYNELNSGTTFKQWRKGIELAQGEYIWIAESDDVAEPFFLEKLIQAITSNEGVLAFSQSILIDLKGNKLREKPPVIQEDCVMKGNDFIREHLLYGNSIYNASMVVFRKEAIDRSIWDDVAKLKYCGDWLFWSQLALKGKVVEVKEFLNYFRVHNLNVSSKAEKNGLAVLEGFGISQQMSKKLAISKSDFAKQWNDIWLLYRRQYGFSRKTNFKILRMFFIKCPRVVWLFLKGKSQ